MDILGSISSAIHAVCDAVLPPRTRTIQMRALDARDLPLKVRTHTLGTRAITTLLPYRTGATRDLIHALKYDGSGRAAHLAATILEGFLREHAVARMKSTRRMCIIAVPLHPSRMRERGFNQVERVIAHLPETLCGNDEKPAAPASLSRIRPTRAQTRLSRRERLLNMRGAFRAHGDFSGTHVFLIDDVVTTGATLAEAAHALENAGATVSCIALARA